MTSYELLFSYWSANVCSSDLNVIRRTYGFLRPYRRRLVLAGFFAVLYTASTLAGPLLVRTGIDDGIKDANRDVLNRTVIAYVIIAALGYVVYRRQVLAIARIGEDFLKALRIRVFDHLQRLSMPFYDRDKAGFVWSQNGSAPWRVRVGW